MSPSLRLLLSALTVVGVDVMVLCCRIQNRLYHWMPEFVITSFIWLTVVYATWAWCNVSCSSLWTCSCLSMLLLHLPLMHVSGPLILQFSIQCTELYPKHAISSHMTSCTSLHNLRCVIRVYSFTLKYLGDQQKFRIVCLPTFCPSVSVPLFWILIKNTMVTWRLAINTV